MARLILLLGLGLVVVQGLTSGQFNQLLQAVGLQPGGQSVSSGPSLALPPLGNGPSLPGNINTVPGIASAIGLKPRPTLSGGGGGGQFQP